MSGDFPPYVDITYFHSGARPDVDTLAQAKMNVEAIRQAIVWAGIRGGGRIIFPPGSASPHFSGSSKPRLP
jgi:hypothetical protein